MTAAAGRPDPAALVAALAGAGLTVATAESLTAGLLAARLADVPGASRVLRGGVVAYATDVKAHLLDVPRDLLAAVGAVDAAVAAAMATGARGRLAADVGVATTGVAGPDPQDGHPPGTVWVAVATARGTVVRGRSPGDGAAVGERPAVRRAAVDAALGLLGDVLAEHRFEPGS